MILPPDISDSPQAIMTQVSHVTVIYEVIKT